MGNLYGDAVGLTHLIASILATLCGTVVLVMKKGTRIHKLIGYFYFSNMVVLLITAFFIYRLFGKFGIFHYSAVASSLTLILGMLPVWLKKPKIKWLYYHLSFMYWSVLGLYMAFVAEILTRIPNSNFDAMVYISVLIITTIGALYFKKYLRSTNIKAHLD